MKKKITKKPCENCNGTGTVKNKWGTTISCKACFNGKVKITEWVEE
jgi:DnaJ-class molecular chaperone